MRKGKSIGEIQDKVIRGDIGVHMDDHDYEYSSVYDIRCDNGDHEVGILKINPDRVPVVLGLERAEKEMSKIGKCLREIPYKALNDYVIFADDRACEVDGDRIRVYGNAYIARRQKRTHIGLSGFEIKVLAACMIGVQAFREMNEQDDEPKVFSFPVEAE